MAKSVTMQNVADDARVSIATVSRIVNNPESVRESTRRKVLRSMNELGFIQSAPRPADTESLTILIVIQTLSNQFDTDLAASIMNTAYIHGYNSMIVVNNNKNYTTFEAFENIFRDVAIAGIILETGLIDPDLVSALQSHYPVVMASDYIESLDISYVSIDDAAAARTAASYLISTGHTKIALINCDPDYHLTKYREKGFAQALTEAGIEINKNWVLRLSTVNYFMVHSYIRQLLEQKERPDAIFACSDMYGMAAINAAQQLGIRVPEELSVIGFDNTSIASMTNPSLTTVAQPITQIGAQSCELLIQKIRNRNCANQHIVLDTELIIRNSTCPKNMGVSGHM